jgi:hypothetical protein
MLVTGSAGVSADFNLAALTSRPFSFDRVLSQFSTSQRRQATTRSVTPVG